MVLDFERLGPGSCLRTKTKYLSASDKGSLQHKLSTAAASSCSENAFTDTNVAAPQGRWCIMNPTMKTDTYNAVILTICNDLDCSPIKKGGPCFLPNDPYNHASYAVDLFYQRWGRDPKICEGMFGLRTDQDPSYDNCHYP
ncbi:hypothetical protein ACOSQ4_008827 [Xanthoceras sorbifolium]